MRIILRVTAGPFKGKQFTFAGHDTFLVGRSKHTHLRLPVQDRTCSRIHFMIEVNPPHCRLMDMGSRNGTHVNDQRVSVADLKNGDKIRAGANILRVHVQMATPNGPPAAGSGVEKVPPTVILQLVDVAPTVLETLPEAVPVEAEEAPFALPLEEEAAKPPPQAKPVVPALPSTTSQAVAPKTVQPPDTVPPPQALPLSAPRAAEPPAAPPTIEPAPPLGPVIPGYRLVRKLGEGAMGVVYLARRAGDGSTVALKTIRAAGNPSGKDTERFLREAQILRELKHPHIVGFHEQGESDGCLYFVMDYIAGPDGHTVVKNEGPMAVGRAVTLTCQLLEALEYAHARRFVHRDLKPSNVLLATENGRETVKLADFGLARVYQSSQWSGLTMSGDIGGTPAFMAPEQLLNFRESPPSVDQYAAAATLYFLLTAKYVYDLPKERHYLFAMLLNDDPVPIRNRRKDIPAALAKVIHRALTREPEGRFADVAEMRQALEAL